MRVAIVGPGAMGLLFGAYLARGGVDVTLVGRDPEKMARLHREGVTLTEGEATSAVALSATAAPDTVGTFPWVFLTVKAPDTDGALTTMAPLVGETTKILTLQNGVGGAERIAARFGERKVTVGVTAEGATLLGPTAVRHGGAGETQVGGLTPEQQPDPALAALFSAGGFAFAWTDHIDRAVWKKLAANCGINALTALLGVKNLAIATDPHAAGLSAEAVRETWRVAHALGIDLGPEEELVRWVREVAKRTGANRSSMGQDVDRRRATEIGFINEAVVDKGRALGVQTPVNRVLASLVRALEGTFGPTPS